MNNPITGGDTHDKLRGKATNGITKTKYNLFKSGENFVSEPAAAKLFPYLFDWIHLGRIWRNIKDVYVFRNAETAGLVPSGTVAAKENDVVRILLCQETQKEIHANCITVWHNQEAALPGGWLYSPIGITIFSDVMTGNRWTDTLWAPAIFGLVDPPKACFILEHQTYFSTVSIVIVDFFLQFSHFFFNFFEVAMTSSLAFFGCLLRGITFRHPCRHNTR